MTRIKERMVDEDQFTRRKATPDTVRKLQDWEIWTCEDEEFSHIYDRKVSFYVEQGEARLTFTTGRCLDVETGDFVTIEQGAEAHWLIASPLRNRYMYHDVFNSAENRKKQIDWKN